MAGTPIWRRYARLFGPDPAADVDDELRFHLDAKVDDLMQLGWSRTEARREAIRQFGDLRVVRNAGHHLGKEREQHVQHKELWDACKQDFRYALRTLRKDRGFAIITVLILALGIAANTAVFSVVNTVMLRPLPFPESERLVWFESGRKLTPEVREKEGLSGTTYTVAAFQEFQRHNQSFQRLTSYNPFLSNGDMTMTGRGEPRAVSALMVAENFFPTLGVQPIRGRLFTAQECQKGGPLAVILSYPFWERYFAADPAILGQAINLNQRAMTVVGILPPSFDFGSVFSPGTRMDVYTPAVMDEIRNWGNTLALVGRLKPGVSLAQAQTEADILFPQLKAANKDWWGEYDSNLSVLKDFVSGKLRRSLVVLWSAVGLILLLVCVNISNLMLARAAARGREFALRSALGAGKGRLLRQLLTESILLCSAAAVLGLGLAFAITFYLSRQGSIALPLLSSVTVDGAALLWTLLITVSVAFIFGIAPGLNIATGNLQNSLKDSGHGSTAGRKYERLRSALVISEVALACVLLTGAGLLLRSFLRVLDVDMGFQPSHAAAIRVSWDDGGNPDRRGPVIQEMLRNIKAIPGVEEAGISDMLPLGRNRSWGLFVKGKVFPPNSSQSAVVRVVTPGYLAAMGMQLKEGRDFTWNDERKSETVIIINQAAARRYWEGQNPIGRLARSGSRDVRVVGVLADVRANNVETAPGPEMFFPFTQAGPSGAELVIRTKLPPQALAGTVMKTLRALNPQQPAAEFRPLQQIVDRAVSPRRFFVGLVGSFALLGLLLASLGIYGVISYSVTRQTQEIGIRMALGATAPQVQVGIIQRALRLTLMGIAAGSIASLAAAKWIESLLFGTSPTDPLTFAAILLTLATVALIAGYLPARRASGIDPMLALRAN